MINSPVPTVPISSGPIPKRMPTPAGGPGSGLQTAVFAKLMYKTKYPGFHFHVTI